MVNHIITAENQFLIYHNKLIGLLINTKWHFIVWKHVTDAKKEYLEEMNAAPSFFNLTLNSHYLATLVSLNIFFDKAEGKLSMYRFLDFLKENVDIFSNKAYKNRLIEKGIYSNRSMKDRRIVTLETMEHDTTLIRDLPAGNIKKWRNEALAHIGENYILKNIDLSKNYPIKRKHIDSIISTLATILNRYSLAYNARKFEIDIPEIERHAQYILDAIRIEVQNRRKNLKDLFGSTI